MLTTGTIQLFDIDRDGSVTKFELKEALWSLGQHPGHEEMDDIFTEYDIDKNGALDFNEFKRLVVDRLSYKVCCCRHIFISSAGFFVRLRFAEV